MPKGHPQTLATVIRPRIFPLEISLVRPYSASQVRLPRATLAYHEPQVANNALR